jgi:hypothetical protein
MDNLDFKSEETEKTETTDVQNIDVEKVLHESEEIKHIRIYCATQKMAMYLITIQDCYELFWSHWKKKAKIRESQKCETTMKLQNFKYHFDCAKAGFCYQYEPNTEYQTRQVRKMTNFLHFYFLCIRMNETRINKVFRTPAKEKLPLGEFTVREMNTKREQVAQIFNTFRNLNIVKTFPEKYSEFCPLIEEFEI